MPSEPAVEVVVGCSSEHFIVDSPLSLGLRMAGQRRLDLQSETGCLPSDQR